MTKEELDEERKQKIEALYREQYATIFFYAKTIFCQPGCSATIFLRNSDRIFEKK